MGQNGVAWLGAGCSDLRPWGQVQAGEIHGRGGTFAWCLKTPWADSGWPSPLGEIEWADLGSKERKILKTSSGVTERTASLGSERLVPGGI